MLDFVERFSVSKAFFNSNLNHGKEECAIYSVYLVTHRRKEDHQKVCMSGFCALCFLSEKFVS